MFCFYVLRGALLSSLMLVFVYIRVSYGEASKYPRPPRVSLVSLTGDPPAQSLSPGSGKLCLRRASTKCSPARSLRRVVVGPGGAGGSGLTWGAPSDGTAGRAERGAGRSRERPGAEGWGASRPSLRLPDSRGRGQVQRGPRAARLKSALAWGGDAARSAPSLRRCAPAAPGLRPRSRPRSARPASPLPRRP